jgi:hypothetical protein
MNEAAGNGLLKFNDNGNANSEYLYDVANELTWITQMLAVGEASITHENGILESKSYDPANYGGGMSHACGDDPMGNRTTAAALNSCRVEQLPIQH